MSDKRVSEMTDDEIRALVDPECQGHETYNGPHLRPGRSYCVGPCGTDARRMKTVEEYADEIEAGLARFHTISRAELEMTLIACAVGAEVDDTARVEAIRRILAADQLVQQRLVQRLAETR